MNISASISNSFQRNDVTVSTNGASKSIAIDSKPGGYGSAVNGGELLFLSLAVCFCNDVYREATKRGMEVRGVRVEVSGRFGSEGEPGQDILYTVKIDSPHSAEEINDLVTFVDDIAEIHRTIRKGTAIDLITGR